MQLIIGLVPNLFLCNLGKIEKELNFGFLTNSMLYN